MGVSKPYSEAPTRTKAWVSNRSDELKILWKRAKSRWQLYVLLALPLIWLLIFQYYPMYGAQIAFRNYLPKNGFWGSEWVGLENFSRFFNSYMFWRLLRNTIGLSLYTLAVGFPFPILLAMSLNQVRKRFFKQTVQMITYAPYFISTVVMVGLILQMLDLRFGPVNIILQSLGGQPLHFIGDPNLFSSIYVWSGVWQYTGFNCIIYLAALSTVDPDLHEAAMVDGASRLRRIWHIDLPAIMPLAVTLLVLNLGQLMNVGFEKVFLLQNPLNTVYSEVISTYVYKVGLTTGIINFSYAAAIGLFNSVVSMIMIVAANYISRRTTGSGLW